MNKTSLTLTQINWCSHTVLHLYQFCMCYNRQH